LFALAQQQSALPLSAQQRFLFLFFKFARLFFPPFFYHAIYYFYCVLLLTKQGKTKPARE
jgi:hypothetical protein